MSSGRVDDPGDRSPDRPEGLLSSEERRRLEATIRDLNRQFLELEEDGLASSLGELSDRLQALAREPAIQRRAPLSEVLETLRELLDQSARAEAGWSSSDTDLLLEALANILDEARHPGSWPPELGRRLEELCRARRMEGGQSASEDGANTDPPASGETLEAHPFGNLPDIDDSFLLELFREQFFETSAEIEELLLRLEKGTDDAEVAGALKRHVHNLKGAAFQAGLEVVGSYLHAFEERLRRLEEIDDLAAAGRLLGGVDTVTAYVRTPSPEGAERLRVASQELLSDDWQPTVAVVDEIESSQSPISGQTIRVQIEKLDELLDVTGELVQQQIRLDSWLGGLRSIVDGFSRVLRRHRKLREYLDAQRLKMPAEVGDRLVGLERSIRIALGDLHKGVTSYMSTTETDAASSRSLTARLKDHVMSTRMVPVRTLFASVPRIIRDLGRSQSKSVLLVLEGEETELDRRVVDAVRDPLLHLVRNAIDHGLETASERRAAGKPTQGRLTLAARQHGGMVHLRISDDGRGIDPERVRQKAVGAGLLEASDSSQLEESELLELVFKPGFSTRDEASTVSGRGIGLEVVHRAVAALNGQVEVESRLGQGTSFLIKLPLTLAIVRGLIVEAGSERFVIPSSAVENLIQVEPAQVGTLAGRTVLELEGRSVPLESLTALVGAPPRLEEPAKSEALINVVLLTHDERDLGVLVDAPLGERWTVVKQLSQVFDSARLASGATTLGSGEVVVVLDAGELVRAGAHRRGSSFEEVGFAREATAPPPARLRRVVLGPDLEENELRETLEALGLQLEATSQASEVLVRAQDSAVVLILLRISPADRRTVALVKRLKGDERTRRVPLVLVGTEDSDTLRREGLEAGASGFIVQSEVGGESFSRMIHRFTRRGL